MIHISLYILRLKPEKIQNIKYKNIWNSASACRFPMTTGHTSLTLDSSSLVARGPIWVKGGSGVYQKFFCRLLLGVGGWAPSSWEVWSLQPLSNFFRSQYKKNCSTDTDKIFYGKEALLVPNKNMQKTSDTLHFHL